MALLGTWGQQPAEIIDYEIDYSDWFATRTDAPSSLAVVVESGVTVFGSGISGNVVTVTISGATNGVRSKVTARLTTTTGRIKEADFVVVGVET